MADSSNTTIDAAATFSHSSCSKSVEVVKTNSKAMSYEHVADLVSAKPYFAENAVESEKEITSQSGVNTLVSNRASSSCISDDQKSVPLWKKELIQRRRKIYGRAIEAQNQRNAPLTDNKQSQKLQTDAKYKLHSDTSLPVMLLTNTLASSSTKDTIAAFTKNQFCVATTAHIKTPATNSKQQEEGELQYVKKKEHLLHNQFNEQQPLNFLLDDLTSSVLASTFESGHYTIMESTESKGSVRQEKQLACVMTCNTQKTTFDNVCGAGSRSKETSSVSGGINCVGTCLTTSQQPHTEDNSTAIEIRSKANDFGSTKAVEVENFSPITTSHTSVSTTFTVPIEECDKGSKATTASGSSTISLMPRSFSGSALKSSTASSSILFKSSSSETQIAATDVKYSEKEKENSFLKNPEAVNKFLVNKHSGCSSNSAIEIKVSKLRNTGKMVAAQDMNEQIVVTDRLYSESFDFDDPSEELQYGPGIVSKLRCRYLSLALRQSAAKKRPSLDILRRATSLNNLLDNSSETTDDTRSQSSHVDNPADILHSNHHCIQPHYEQKPPLAQTTAEEFVATYQKNAKYADKEKQPRSRHILRGNDSLRRARSVEALLRCDNKSSGNDSDIVETAGTVVVQLRQRYMQHKPTKSNFTVSNADSFHHRRYSGGIEPSNASSLSDATIEEKIINARERLSSYEKPPKRLSSFMDETERPPPDVVKQTLKIFEGTNNRRGRGLSRNNFSGEVAAKIANYKSIISQEKPPIIFPKPPLSPKKHKLNFRKPASLDIAAVRKQKIVNCTHSAISPISNLAKNGAPSGSVNKNLGQSSLSSGYFSDITFLSQAVTSESTPIRASAESGLEKKSDLIPRANFEKLLNSVESPNTGGKNLHELINISSEEGSFSPNVTLSSSPDNAISSRFTTADDSLDGEAHIASLIYSPIDNFSPILKPTIAEKISFSAQENKKNSSHAKTLPTASAPGAIVITAAVPNGEVTRKESSLTTLLSSTNKQTTIKKIATAKQVGVIRPLLFEPRLQLDLTQSPAEGTRLSAVRSDFISGIPESTSSSKVGDTRDKKDLAMLQLLNNTSSETNAIKTGLVLRSNSKSQLTSREIEKNLINEKKTNEQQQINVLGKDVAGNSSAMSTKNTENSSRTETIKWQLTKKKPKSHAPLQPPAVQQNTMVFNFKDRKEVPDYIESDGLLFKGRRELPKPNESGFVLLGDLSLETSTDADESWDLGPPSPCDVEFENANILIDGKSSLRIASKEISLRVQFDDTLNSTYEYPSESSLLENSFPGSDLKHSKPVSVVATITSTPELMTAGLLSTEISAGSSAAKNSSPKVLGSMSLGSAPLSNYQPIKAQINTHFKLGVTRVPSVLSETGAQSRDNSVAVKSYNALPNGDSKRTATTKDAKSNNTISPRNGSRLENDGDEPESYQYLKPATDDLTVIYSESTQKTDLLY